MLSLREKTEITEICGYTFDQKDICEDIIPRYIASVKLHREI